MNTKVQRQGKHLSPPRVSVSAGDDWESWGCGAGKDAATLRRGNEESKGESASANKISSSKFSCVPTPMEQAVMSNTTNNGVGGSMNVSNKVPTTPTAMSRSSRGFGNANKAQDAKKFTRLYRTSSPERKASSPTAQVIQSIDEAVDSVLTKSYSGFVGAVSSIASTLDAAVETTALKLDHFASQKMSPPNARRTKSNTNPEDPMSSPEVIKMRCRESISSTSNNSYKNVEDNWGWNEDASSSMSTKNFNNKENVDPAASSPRRLSKALQLQNERLRNENRILAAKSAKVEKQLEDETQLRKKTQRDLEELKKQNIGLQKRQQSKELASEQDELMEQVRAQLQTLINEKAILAAQNDRLARENETLHGFLSHMSESDGEC